MFPAVWRTILVHEIKRHSRKLSCELQWICQGCSRDDELRKRTIKMAQAQQPPKQKCDMGSKDPAVPVCLIYHNKFQVRKEWAPFCVPGEHLVQFMRVGDQNPGVFPYSSSL